MAFTGGLTSSDRLAVDPVPLEAIHSVSVAPGRVFIAAPTLVSRGLRSPDCGYCTTPRFPIPSWALGMFKCALTFVRIFDWRTEAFWMSKSEDASASVCVQLRREACSVA